LFLQLLDLAVLFQELVEQHCVDGVLADRVWLSFFVGQHQRGIYLGDFFSDQTKLRCVLGVRLVVEGDRPQCQDCFTCFLHIGDVFLESLGGSNRAKLTVIGNNDWRGHAALRRYAKDIAYPGGVVDVCTDDTEANTDNVTGRGDTGTRVGAYGDVSHAGSIVCECTATDRGIAIAGVVKERVTPDSCIALAGSVIFERTITHGCV
jgi:hypothetical protein